MKDTKKKIDSLEMKYLRTISRELLIKLNNINTLPELSKFQTGIINYRLMANCREMNQVIDIIVCASLIKQKELSEIAKKDKPEIAKKDKPEIAKNHKEVLSNV